MAKFNTKKHGYPDDEVKSALQKEIRRGYEDQAMYWALELANEGKSSFGWLRNRLKIIAYEDIGLANPDVVNQVSKAVDDMDYLYQNNNDEWEMVLSYIILLLCRSKKNRLVDYFKVALKDYWDTFEQSIPDYAKDYHTESGNKMGRTKYSKQGKIHFEEEGSYLDNKVDVEDTDYWYDYYLKSRGIKKEELDLE